jgi:hypothetical protein
MRNFIISIFLFFMLIGCSGTQNIYVDGMPISDHEYFAKTPEGLSAAFILVRYYEKKFGDESMTYPEYLDLFDNTSTIDIDKTSQLILHVKIVNINREKFTVWWKFEDKKSNEYRMLYQGQLPRKDLAIRLPLVNLDENKFEVVFAAEKEELFRIWGEYKNEGGDTGE